MMSNTSVKAIVIMSNYKISIVLNVFLLSFPLRYHHYLHNSYDSLLHMYIIKNFYIKHCILAYSALVLIALQSFSLIFIT